jgi:diketogulonate reductase-like aldo/keto reductase
MQQHPMTTRAIPSTGEAMPVIGLGTWQAFDVGDDPAALAQRRQVLETLFAAGGRMIDSSPMYGRSEAVVGRLLGEMGARDKAFLATKVWISGGKAGVAQMQASMEKMQAGQTLDLMQIHNLVDWRTHLPTLRAWRAEGRFRTIGITHFTVSAFDELMAIMRTEPIDFVQLPYSLAVRAAEDRLLPLAADKGIAVIPNRPFDGANMFRRVKGRALPDFAAELGATSFAQLFLKYLVGHPAVTCVIPGTASPAHMRDNVAAGFGAMPDTALRRRIVDWFEKG